MNAWIIILIIFTAALLVFLIIPTVLAFFAVFGKKKAVPFEEYNREKYKNHYYIPYLKRIAEERGKIVAQSHREVEIASYDGLKLCGEYYDIGSKKTAILIHGLGAEIYTNFASQANFFYNNGFNVLLVRHRAHGKSEGKWTTIGLLEQYDVLSWTEWAENHGAEQILLYGLSMGAAAIAYASEKLENTKVRGIVLDSCYYSVYEQMKKDAVKLKIPKIMLITERLAANIAFGVDTKASTADALAKSKRPALIIQGTNDLTVDPQWGKVIYDACAEPKEYLLVEGGHHTLNYLHNPDLTGRVILNFTDKYF